MYLLQMLKCSAQQTTHTADMSRTSMSVLQILTEIAGETLGQMAAAPHNKVPAAAVAVEQEEEEEDAEAADLQARLNAIRS